MDITKSHGRNFCFAKPVMSGPFLRIAPCKDITCCPLYPSVEAQGNIDTECSPPDTSLAHYVAHLSTLNIKLSKKHA